MRRDLLNPLFSLIILAAFALLAAGCGSNNDSDAPPPGSIMIGKVTVPTTASMRDGFVTMAAGDPIIVSVEEYPDIRTTVGADGTFTLRGLPAGAFTLVFIQGGEIVGRLRFEEVAINQQITIDVELTNGEIVLLNEDRRGIGHAGIELEGLVTAVLAVNPAADSRFTIAGRTVIARPGVTAIRKGTTRKTVADVVTGLQVHVKGTAIQDSSDVLAYEIKLQDETTDDAATGEEKKIEICHYPGGDATKKRTIKISVSAWPAHQKHGDTEGPC